MNPFPSSSSFPPSLLPLPSSLLLSPFLPSFPPVLPSIDFLRYLIAAMTKVINTILLASPISFPAACMLCLSSILGHSLPLPWYQAIMDRTQRAKWTLPPWGILWGVLVTVLLIQHLATYTTGLPGEIRSLNFQGDDSYSIQKMWVFKGRGNQILSFIQHLLSDSLYSHLATIWIYCSLR